MNEAHTMKKTYRRELYIKRAIGLSLIIAVGFVLFSFLMYRHLLNTSQTLQIQIRNRCGKIPAVLLDLQGLGSV